MSSAQDSEKAIGAFRIGRLAPPYALITLAMIVAAWQLASDLFGIPTFLLPSPKAVVAVMQDHSGLLLTHAKATLTSILLGFTISVLVGVPLATLICYSTVLDRMLYPLIVTSQTIPKVAIAPILLTAFGYGLGPKIAIVVLVSFFPIVINTVTGLRSASAEMMYLARSMGASPMQTFLRFRLPQALPSIFAGMKLASVLSVIGAIVAEFVGGGAGLGYIIVVAGSNFRMDQQFAAIIILSIQGMTFFWLLGVAERSLMPWHVSVRNRQ